MGATMQLTELQIIQNKLRTRIFRILFEDLTRLRMIFKIIEREAENKQN